MAWLGELADELKTGLPWIMCHGAHANNTIETYNGCDGTSFVDGLVAQNEPVSLGMVPAVWVWVCGCVVVVCGGMHRSAEGLRRRICTPVCMARHGSGRNLRRRRRRRLGPPTLPINS